MMDKMKHTKIERISVAIMGFMAVLSLIFVFFESDGLVVAEKPKIEEKETLKIPPVFKAPEIEAKSVYIYDLGLQKLIYAKDEEKQLPLASITKIMTAIVALENTSPDSVVKVSDKLLNERGGGDIKSGEVWSLKNLIDFSLLVSSNDGARAIASAVGSFVPRNQDENPEDFFVDKMNQKVKEIGLTQTYFINESGLDLNENTSGSYGSAKDAALLLTYAYEKYPEAIESTGYGELDLNSLSGEIHKAKNSNEAYYLMPGVAASKTGFTDIAGGNIVVIFEAGPMHPIVISILGSGKEERFEDIKKVYDATLSYLSSKD